MVINNMFTYHFVDPDLETEIFFKKSGGNRIEGRRFQNRGLRHLQHTFIGVEGNFMQSLSTFLLFLVTKKE